VTAFESYFLNKEFIWKPGLGRIKNAVASLPFFLPPSAIVAGTNGKGSTSTFIASILKSHGVRTGLFTSPHLFSFNERFKINLESVCIDVLDKAFLKLLPIIEENSLTYFEAAFLLSLYLFKDCDFAVYEVGLGGRLDATNSIEHNLAVITHIDYDHKDYLGETIEEIALEKLHVIKNGIPAVISDNREVVFELAKRFTENLSVFWMNFDLDSVKVSGNGTYGVYEEGDIQIPFHLSVYGEHQAVNAATAIFSSKKILREIFNVELNILKVQEALLSVKMPGRFEVLRRKPLFIVDVAHNVDAVKRFLKTAESLGFSFDVVYSGLKDKEFDEIVKLLESFVKKVGAELFIVPIENSRGFSFEELEKKYGDRAVVSEKLDDEVLDRDIAILGSFYLVSDIVEGYFK